jgi:hypothetical protein
MRKPAAKKSSIKAEITILPTTDAFNQYTRPNFSLKPNRKKTIKTPKPV